MSCTAVHDGGLHKSDHCRQKWCILKQRFHLSRSDKIVLKLGEIFGVSHMKLLLLVRAVSLSVLPVTRNNISPNKAKLVGLQPVLNIPIYNVASASSPQ